MKKKSKTNKKGKSSIHKVIKYIWVAFASGLALMVLLFFLISMGWMGFMPSFEELENPKTNLATEVYSEDGYLLGKFYIENRSSVHYHQLPENIVHALVATEDARFYRHSGVDVRAILRAVSGVLTFSNKGGGSTISQQLAKNLFPRENNRSVFKTVFIKLKEWVVAVKLERNYSKEEILAMYLNTVDFGNMSHGINSAAKTYFDKAPKDLTTEESALLVGMLKAPSKFNPKRNPENAKQRRNVVLGQMHKYGYLEDDELDTLREKEIDMSHFKVQDHRVGTATYFREFLRQQVSQWAKENPKPDGTYWNIYSDGLKIYTSINYKMQLYAEQAVKEWITNSLQDEFFKEWKGVKNAPFYKTSEKDTESILVRAMKSSERYKTLKELGWSEEKIRKNFDTPTQMWLFDGQDEKDTLLSPMDSIRHMKSYLNCGFLVMEPSTGKVRAYVGGTNFEYFQYDHVTMSRRQVGSTFKPFVYTIALQDGEFVPCSQVPNLPVTIDLPTGQSWTPKNSSKYKEGQMVTLSEALANSMNNISAYLIKRFGAASVINLIKAMGVKSEVPEVPSICLGACELTLEEMVGAINTFNNKGVYMKPLYITRITTNKGNTLAVFETSQNEAIDQLSAYKTVRLMQGVVEGGTASRLNYRYKLNMPMAGKTGTTDENSDAWFMGFTPLLTAGVWVGCEDRQAHFRSTALGQGANAALPVWAIFMKKCYEDPTLGLKKIDFPKPDNPEADVNFLNCKDYKPSDNLLLP